MIWYDSAQAIVYRSFCSVVVVSKIGLSFSYLYDRVCYRLSFSCFWMEHLLINYQNFLFGWSLWNRFTNETVRVCSVQISNLFMKSQFSKVVRCLSKFCVITFSPFCVISRELKINIKHCYYTAICLIVVMDTPDCRHLLVSLNYF